MKLKIPTIGQILRSASFYPLTLLYLAAMVCGFLVADHDLSIFSAVVLLSIALIVAMLSATLRELRDVRHRIDETRQDQDGPGNPQ